MLLCDLPPLYDVLDEIVCSSEDDDDELNDVYETILHLIDEYILNNPTEI